MSKAAPLEQLLFSNLSLRGAAAPARPHHPLLISSLEAGRIDPSPFLDLALPLGRVADGYTAMDERLAVKVLLTVS